MEAAKEQYIGHKKVMGVTKIDGLKTPLGSDVLRVLYSEGSSQMMSQKSFDAQVTEVPFDASLTRDKKVLIARKLIMNIIAEYDFAKVDLEYVWSCVLEDFTDNLNRASNFIWNKQDDLFVPGENVMSHITLSQALDVLQTIPSKHVGETNEPEAQAVAEEPAA